jgi:hypothetical protein
VDVPKQKDHQLTLPFSLTHSLSSSSTLSLSTLSPTLNKGGEDFKKKEEKARRRKEKGLELGSSRRW